MGGYTSEFEISLKSGQVVASHLNPEKYEVYPVVITKNRWTFTTPTGEVYPIQKGASAACGCGWRELCDQGMCCYWSQHLVKIQSPVK